MQRPVSERHDLPVFLGDEVWIARGDPGHPLGELLGRRRDGFERDHRCLHVIRVDGGTAGGVGDGISVPDDH
jgi:hypothetical protein